MTEKKIISRDLFNNEEWAQFFGLLNRFEALTNTSKEYDLQANKEFY